MSNERPLREVLQGEPIPFDLMAAVEGLVNWIKLQEVPKDDTLLEATWNQLITKIAKDLNYTVDTVERAYASVFAENIPLSSLYENSATYPLHTKPKKPNTGFKLGSYTYKSKRK